MPKSPLHSSSAIFAILLCFLLADGVPLLDLSSGELDAVARRVCAGKIGECEAAAEEMVVDSESNRRELLMRRRYISYETLKRDLVPCDRPGASYYNCRGPGVANSYSRGCEIITRCARGD